MKLDYTSAADALAARYGIPGMLFSSLINAESAWNPNAVSPTGATGLGQFTMATAIDYGLMGADFDNRKDAALNLTAAARYLAKLRRANPTWRAVIGHYSGQDPATFPEYSKYSAGQMLIMAIDAADGVTIPPPVGGDIEVTVGVTQGGAPTKFNLKAISAVVLMLLAAGSIGLTCCSAQKPPPQIASAQISSGFWAEHPPTFYFDHGPDGGLRAVPLRGK